MKTIWKYEIDLDELDKEASIWIEMPEGATFAHCGPMPETPNRATVVCIRMNVDTEQRTVKRRFAVIGTGPLIPAKSKVWYRGTVVIQPYAWHVLEY